MIPSGDRTAQGLRGDALQETRRSKSCSLPIIVTIPRLWAQDPVTGVMLSSHTETFIRKSQSMWQTLKLNTANWRHPHYTGGQTEALLGSRAETRTQESACLTSRPQGNSLVWAVEVHWGELRLVGSAHFWGTSKNRILAGQGTTDKRLNCSFPLTISGIAAMCELNDLHASNPRRRRLLERKSLKEAPQKRWWLTFCLAPCFLVSSLCAQYFSVRQIPY